ncbi:MAG TPA: response regulator [Nitrososphaera sp.]|nr:response regulator [Nitrososphaera sp.]
MNSRRELIMIVDDEQDILQILRAGLSRYGHKVMIFSDPVLALKEFELNHSDYSLILTDLRMPSMSGIEFGLKVRQVDPGVRLMIMTAFELSTYELSHDIPYVRTEDLLKKPISLSSVCKAIDKGAGTH